MLFKRKRLNKVEQMNIFDSQVINVNKRYTNPVISDSDKNLFVCWFRSKVD